MSKKRYQPLQNELNTLLAETKLPFDRPIAIYYRQSTDAQVGNVSTVMQTVDMATLLERYGWRKEQIILIDADAGVSGSTKIDEREGMSQLFRLITGGDIGAVACQDEDRLFRDVTQIQVNIFIEACKSSRVLVITPTMVYDFAHAAYGNFHARQFRFKSEMAAEYIISYIRGKLHPAKRRLLMNGRWAGPPIPPGFMIDMRKELPGGLPNPNWRKLAIFEPYAEVVRAYWDLFLHYGGQIRPTARHIAEHGPYFPDPYACQPPEGFKVVYRLRQVHGKWCQTRTGLKGMLTNAMYIGHWMVNGSIVIWDNHPALIPQDTFMQAFHYLSKVSLDGHANPQYAPIRVFSQPSKREERDEEWPLCSGLIFAQYDNGVWHRVDTHWSKTNSYYGYEFSTKDDHSLWWKKAEYVDAAVCRVLIGKLQATFDFDTWERAVAGFVDKFEQEQTLMRSQLQQLETVMNNLVASLETLKNPHMIRATEKRFADAEVEAKRLRLALANLESETIRVEQVRELRDSCGDIVNNWPEMDEDERRQVLHAFVKRIDARSLHGKALELTIRWKDETSTIVELPNMVGGGSVAWMDEETQKLVTLFMQRKNQLEIARHFPDRTWDSILQRYYAHVAPQDRVKVRRKRVIRTNETYREYVARTSGKLLADRTIGTHSERVRPCGRG